MIYVVLIILALNYNLVIKSVAHILAGVFVLFLYTTYIVYILSVILVNTPSNTLENIKRIYKYINK